jgi:hypothetical protein
MRDIPFERSSLVTRFEQNCRTPLVTQRVKNHVKLFKYFKTSRKFTLSHCFGCAYEF